jgi:hypothetical protein
MAEEVKRGPGRPRKDASTVEERKHEAKLGQEFGGTSYSALDEEFERLQAVDERAEDRRPATIANRETGETYPDNRQQPQDLVQAVNVMTGRAAMHINDSPHPHLDRPFVGVLGREPTPDPMADPSQEGEEVVILRNYQPHGDPLPPRLTAGTVTKLPLSEAKKLIKRGVVQFVDEDRE